MVFTLDSVHQLELDNSLELVAVDMFALEAGTGAESLSGIRRNFAGNPFGLVPGVETKNVLLVIFDHSSDSIAGTYVIPGWRPVSQSDIISMEPAEGGANQVAIRNTAFNAGEHNKERMVTWSAAPEGGVRQIRVSEPRIVPSGNYQGGPPQ